MGKYLIIVESPNKINSIKSYLGNDYDVVASYGHIRELNKKKGFNEETFDPIWEVVNAHTKNSKKTIIDNIKKNADNYEKIYLATDPDREGEAISWHLYEILPKKAQKVCKRITFNEVTKSAILDAIKNEHDIDINLVHSQFTRRILDRIIGYKLSSFTKRSLNAISAGRVQSIALLFVVERELERRAFIPTNWYEISANIDNNIVINFTDINKQFESYPETTHSTIPFRFNKEDEAKKVYNSLTKEFKLVSITDPKKSNNDHIRPLTTDKLLQLASSYYNWNTSKTTNVAQKMFEGIEFMNESIGLISYPRTDSERLNDDFVNATKEYIRTNYGENYISDITTTHKKNTKKDANIQDAHEAIRPVSISLTPNELAKDNKIPKDVLKLYELIWTRTIASLMVPPIFDNINLIFDNNNYNFIYAHKTLVFDGYFILDWYDKEKKLYQATLPNLNIGNIYIANKIDLSKKEKQPPPYYTEATLIAALKDAGVGRPSTYSTMARIGETRGYINKQQQKLIPNEIGISVIELLTNNFSNVITKKFTAQMETELDEIANGKLDWKEPLYAFYDEFKKQISVAYEKVEKLPDEKVGELCPECNSDLVYKLSRFGTKFIGCSSYPNCKYTRSIVETVYLDENCPECNNRLIIKSNKKNSNKKFIGCSGYPKCHFIKPIYKTDDSSNNKNNEKK